MIMTNHAVDRSTKRNISDMMLEIIETNGKIEHVKGGAIKIFFGKKESANAISELKKMIKLIEKSSGGTLIVSENKALTVYKNLH